jgi:hypothetical protein
MHLFSGGQLSGWQRPEKPSAEKNLSQPMPMAKSTPKPHNFHGCIGILLRDKLFAPTLTAPKRLKPKRKAQHSSFYEI